MKILEKILDLLPVYTIIVVQVAIFLLLTRLENKIEQQNVLLGRFQIDTSNTLVMTVQNNKVDSLRKHYYNQKKTFDIKDAK